MLIRKTDESGQILHTDVHALLSILFSKLGMKSYLSNFNFCTSIHGKLRIVKF